MFPKDKIPVSRLFEMFTVDFTLGKLFWKVKSANRIKIGDFAGTKRPCGHLFVQLDNRAIAVHRIVWAMQHGQWPDGLIDHINQNPTDNRPENLRLSTKGQNRANISKTFKNNKCGFTGVVLRRKKYVAFITKDKKQKYLGSFNTAEEAHQAYIAAHRCIHSKFSPFAA